MDKTKNYDPVVNGPQRCPMTGEPRASVNDRIAFCVRTYRFGGLSSTQGIADELQGWCDAVVAVSQKPIEGFDG